MRVPLPNNLLHVIPTRRKQASNDQPPPETRCLCNYDKKCEKLAPPYVVYYDWYGRPVGIEHGEFMSDGKIQRAWNGLLVPEFYEELVYSPSQLQRKLDLIPGSVTRGPGTKTRLRIFHIDDVTRNTCLAGTVEILFRDGVFQKYGMRDVQADSKTLHKGMPAFYEEVTWNGKTEDRRILPRPVNRLYDLKYHSTNGLPFTGVVEFFVSPEGCFSCKEMPGQETVSKIWHAKVITPQPVAQGASKWKKF